MVYSQYEYYHGTKFRILRINRVTEMKTTESVPEMFEPDMFLDICTRAADLATPRPRTLKHRLQLPLQVTPINNRNNKKKEPCQEIMVRFVLRKLILQTHMGLDIWLLVGPFVFFHTSCVRTAKALARLRGCRLIWAFAGRLCGISTISHELAQFNLLRPRWLSNAW